MTEEDFVINNYAFQTVAISGTQGSVIISGLNDFNALSGSQTQAFPANPYPEAFVDSNGATTVYGALGMPYGQHSTGGRSTISDRLSARPGTMHKPHGAISTLAAHLPESPARRTVTAPRHMGSMTEVRWLATCRQTS